MALQTEKLQRNIALAIIMAESTHIFCCVIPTIVTLISLLSSVGVISQVPVLLLDFHEVLHAYEIPIILFSGAMLGLGWALYTISRRVECQKDHCEPHETVCAPQKNNSYTVLLIATAIFTINIVVYSVVHLPYAHLLHEQEVAAHAHDHHHD